MKEIRDSTDDSETYEDIKNSTYARNEEIKADESLVNRIEDRKEDAECREIDGGYAYTYRSINIDNEDIDPVEPDRWDGNYQSDEYRDAGFFGKIKLVNDYNRRLRQEMDDSGDVDDEPSRLTLLRVGFVYVFGRKKSADKILEKHDARVGKKKAKLRLLVEEREKQKQEFAKRNPTMSLAVVSPTMGQLYEKAAENNSKIKLKKVSIDDDWVLRKFDNSSDHKYWRSELPYEGPYNNSTVCGLPDDTYRDAVRKKIAVYELATAPDENGNYAVDGIEEFIHKVRELDKATV